MDISSSNQFEKAQVNQPMKGSRGISEFFLNKLSKLQVENSETLYQKPKVEDTFSPSHDMAEDVSSY